MLISLDTEVAGLHRSLKSFMVSACDEHGAARVWEWPVDPFTRSVDPPIVDVHEIIDYISGHEVIFHHGQFDILKLANIGIQLSLDSWSVPPQTKRSWYAPVKAIHETMLLSHLTDSRGVYRSRGKEAKSSHALKELCLVRLGVSDRDEIDLRKAVQSARLKADKIGWNTGATIDEDYWLPKALYDAPLSVYPDDRPQSWEHLCRDYALRDARDRTMQLFLTCREILQEDGRWEMYLDEAPLIPIFYMLEKAGLRTTTKKRDQIASAHRTKAAAHKKILKTLTKNPGINIDSDPQIRKILFEQWKMTPTHLTPKKKDPSVNAKSLEGIRDYLAYHPEENPTAYAFLVHLIGEKDYEQSTDTRPVIKSPGYRQHIKLLGYLDFYTREAIDDIFHATIFPCGTGTTRISTKGSQNVGKKKVDGDSLRSAFGPPPGSIWVSIDYEQLELRIFAALAQDENLIEAFLDGYDFHSFVASRIFDLSSEKITSEQRRIAKNTNFALIFGGSPWRVDMTAGMKGAYDLFSQQFPSARRFMDETIAEVKANGFIETIDGYPLYAPEGEPYKGTDYKVQGTAGRIIKLAMKWLFYGRDSKPLINWTNLKMIVQIHDELLFEIDTRKRSRNDTIRLIRSIMTVMEEAGQALGIPTPVSATIHRDNWGTGISIKEFAA